MQDFPQCIFRGGKRTYRPYLIDLCFSYFRIVRAGSAAARARSGDELVVRVGMAGYGLAGAGFATGCQIAGKFKGVDISPASSWMLAPIQITQGDDGAPDSIRVMRSNAPDFALPLLVAEEHLKSGDRFVMRNVMTNVARSGDLMLVDNVRTAPFAAAYAGADPKPPTMPNIELTLTTEP